MCIFPVEFSCEQGQWHRLGEISTVVLWWITRHLVLLWYVCSARALDIFWHTRSVTIEEHSNCCMAKKIKKCLNSKRFKQNLVDRLVCMSIRIFFLIPATRACHLVRQTFPEKSFLSAESRQVGQLSPESHTFKGDSRQLIPSCLPAYYCGTCTLRFG